MKNRADSVKHLSDRTIGSRELECPDSLAFRFQALLLLQHTGLAPAWPGFFFLLHHCISHMRLGLWLCRVALLIFLETGFAGRVLYSYVEIWEAGPHCRSVILRLPAVELFLKLGLWRHKLLGVQREPFT